MQPWPFRVLMVVCGLCGIMVGIIFVTFAVVGYPPEVYHPYFMGGMRFLASMGGAVLFSEKIMGGKP